MPVRPPRPFAVRSRSIFDPHLLKIRRTTGVDFKILYRTYYTNKSLLAPVWLGWLLFRYIPEGCGQMKANGNPRPTPMPAEYGPKEGNEG
jgi:hypothetical protein